MLVAALATVGFAGGGIERLESLDQIATGPVAPQDAIPIGDGGEASPGAAELSSSLSGARLPGEPAGRKGLEPGAGGAARDGSSGGGGSSSSDGGGDSGGSGGGDPASAPAAGGPAAAPEPAAGGGGPVDRIVEAAPAPVPEPVEDLTRPARPITREFIEPTLGRGSPGRVGGGLVPRPGED